MTVNAVFLLHDKQEHYVWRRLHVSNQQAERQKKSVIQLCLAFHQRASKMQQD